MRTSRIISALAAAASILAAIPGCQSSENEVEEVEVAAIQSADSQLYEVACLQDRVSQLAIRGRAALAPCRIDGRGMVNGEAARSFHAGADGISVIFAYFAPAFELDSSSDWESGRGAPLPDEYFRYPYPVPFAYYPSPTPEEYQPGMNLCSTSFGMPWDPGSCSRLFGYDGPRESFDLDFRRRCSGGLRRSRRNTWLVGGGALFNQSAANVGSNRSCVTRRKLHYDRFW